MTLDLAAGTAASADWVATVTAVEGAYASIASDELLGDDRDNVFYAGPGEDVIDGRGGTDRCEGGEVETGCEE